MTLPCALCDKPMNIAEGQLAFTHKHCRREARRKGLKVAIQSSRQRFELERSLKGVDAAVHGDVV